MDEVNFKEVFCPYKVKTNSYYNQKVENEIIEEMDNWEWGKNKIDKFIIKKYVNQSE